MKKALYVIGRGIVLEVVASYAVYRAIRRIEERAAKTHYGVDSPEKAVKAIIRKNNQPKEIIDITDLQGS